MSENKHLAWMLGIIMFCTLALVGGVIAHDRGVDQAMIDHLFDFHFDPQEALEADRERWEDQKRETERKQQQYDKFVDEVRNWARDSDSSSSDRGTYTPPENNGCRD